MIRVFSHSIGDAAQVEAAVDGPVAVVQDAAAVATDEGGDTTCLIIAYRRWVMPEAVELLREIERTLPLVPVILVTDRDSAVARWLSNVRVSALIWFDELETQLPDEIVRVRSTSGLSHLAGVIHRSDLPRLLRTGLAHSLRKAQSTPVRCAGELARAIRCSPVTLSQQFADATARATTLNRFLGGLVLLRAHQLHLSGLNWESVSRIVRFARPTLTRKSQRWPGCTLRELECMDPDQLFAAFNEKFVRPLLSGPDRETAGN
ncbi:MAG: hypothetical protein F4Y74_13705 [Gemmatimonadales bacterium]|nr:hypothetical protein [Gemmatimonadales bacterium]MYG18526.1 hypothetical protein [Gemmatimonadales bacterium]MYH10531.1 hypothetical protein [Gemmatimonadales bacterium]MYL06556.1 hypothetical protein [Gemmatimonadales bacterium]